MKSVQLLQCSNVTFDVIFNILFTPCKFQKTLKNKK